MLPLHPWLKKCLEYLDKLPQIQTIATTEPYCENAILTDGKLILTTQQTTNTIHLIIF